MRCNLPPFEEYMTDHPTNQPINWVIAEIKTRTKQSLSLFSLAPNSTEIQKLKRL